MKSSITKRTFTAAIRKVPVTAAAGLEHPADFTVAHFARRVSPREIAGFEQLYPQLAAGELIAGSDDPRFRDAWKRARPDTFVGSRTG